MEEEFDIYDNCEPEYVEINYFWDKISEEFIKKFIKFLEKERISNPEDPPFFIGEFVHPNHWRIETVIKRLYNINNFVTETEEIITKIEGVLLCRFRTGIIKPSIPFSFTQELNNPTGTLTFNEKTVKQVLFQREIMKKDSKVEFSLSNDTLMVSNEKAENLKNKAMNEAKSALKNLGFSTDEINLMTKSVVSSQDISGLSVENLVGELLRYR